MKQYAFHTEYRGLNLIKTFCSKTKTNAGKLLGITQYTLNNYCLSFTPQDKICIDNPEMLYAYFDSGEGRYAFPTFYKKIVPFDELSSMVDKHRLTFKTYRDTIHFSDTGKLPI